MAFNLRTHETVGGRIVVRPYTRVMVQGYPPVFVQGGKFYSEGGQEYDPLPPGIENELEKMSPEAIKEVGLDPDNRTQPFPEPVVRPVRRASKPKVDEVVEEEAGATEDDPAADETADEEPDPEAAAEAAPVRATRKKRAT